MVGGTPVTTPLIINKNNYKIKLLPTINSGPIKLFKYIYFKQQCLLKYTFSYFCLVIFLKNNIKLKLKKNINIFIQRKNFIIIKIY